MKTARPSSPCGPSPPTMASPPPVPPPLPSPILTAACPPALS